MMNIIKFLKKILNINKKDINTKKIEETNLYPNLEIKNNRDYESEKEENIQENQILFSLWDYISCLENTQAHHLVTVIPYDTWIDMHEIRRRIWDLFQIEYKNDRSLYPYLKTLVDLGIVEISNIGGKRKWRKKDLLIKIKQNKKIKESDEIKIKEQKTQ